MCAPILQTTKALQAGRLAGELNDVPNYSKLLKHMDVPNYNELLKRMMNQSVLIASTK